MANVEGRVSAMIAAIAAEEEKHNQQQRHPQPEGHPVKDSPKRHSLSTTMATTPNSSDGSNTSIGSVEFHDEEASDNGSDDSMDSDDVDSAEEEDSVASLGNGMESDDSSDDEESIGDDSMETDTVHSRSTARSGDSSVYSSDYDSSEDDSEYDDLMAEMPIALGRKGLALPSKGRTMEHASTDSKIPESVPVEAPLPVPAYLPQMDADQPMEGLAMLSNIRAELQKVGELIVAKKDGEKFLQRAHVLTSINWLSSNVPSCVLEYLGKEIRAANALEQESRFQQPGVMESVQVIDEESSEASDLSEGNMSDSSSDSDYSEEDDDFLFDDQVGAGPHARPEVTVSWNPTEAKPVETDVIMTDTPSPDMHMIADYISHSETQRGAFDLPAIQYFQCALLFVDIAGFTKLSTLLDPENLSKVINSYFQKIVDKVFEFQGDIQKFAGDALFAEWRSGPNMTLEQCVEAAAACAASLVKECSDFPVMAFGDGMFETDHASPISTLHIHCGLGCGEMAGIHVGNDQDRREYIYLGHPIIQAGTACEKASLGEAVASLRFNYILKKMGANNGAFDHHENKNLIVQKATTCVNPDRFLQEWKGRPRHHKSRGVTEHVDGLNVEALIEYRRLMSLYVHPVVLSNDVAESQDFKSSKAVNGLERHREEAELRSAYVMFINPLIPINLTGNQQMDMKSAQRLNDIMNLVNRELRRYSGHLRQFIVDDKGVVLIATFGLRGSTFPNMVCERALPATVVIHNALQMEIGVENKIGATFGDVYCGAVGGEKRHEYSVMGPSVNLAARLMDSQDNPGILVDNAVRSLAHQSYGFNALDPVQAKGYADLVPIFEPLSPLDRAWGRVDPNFVGRDEQIRQLLAIARESSRSRHVPSRMVMVSGSSGAGKSALIVQTIEKIGKTMGRLISKAMTVIKHVGKEQESMVPFATVTAIILRALARFQKSSDDQSRISCSTFAHSVTSGVSGNSASTLPSLRQSADILSTVFGELQTNVALSSYVKGLLLKNDDRHFIGEDHPRPDEIAVVEILARILMKCIETSRLTIIALDDAHQIDEMSWRVLQIVFESANNVVVIGTTSSTATCMLRVNPDFWKDLKGSYLTSGRFVDMQLDPLSQDEILLLTMKKLGLQKDKVTSDMLREVWTQSGGMPQFASEILANIKVRQENEEKKISQLANGSVKEIILHRIDSLETTVRNALNVGAVMDANFSLGDVIAATREHGENPSRQAEHMRQTSEALQVAVEEGILEVVSVEHTDEDTGSQYSESTTFCFHHEIWKTTLVGLMLDSRKRDIHRKIAAATSKELESHGPSQKLLRKMFLHWKGAGDTQLATDTALQFGQLVDSELSCQKESVRIYAETLQMWRWSNCFGDGLAGFSDKMMNVIGPEHLSNMVRIVVAMGKSLYKDNLYRQSITAYQNAIKIIRKSQRSSEIRDRSVIFPAYTGLVGAIHDGHIDQDAYCRFEHNLLQEFLQETRSHGRLIHHIHALYLQQDLYGRLADLDKALAVQSIIRNLYKPEKHSSGLQKHYMQDSAALSFARSAYWQTLEGATRLGLRTCRAVLKDSIPRLELDFMQSFNIMFPVTLVLFEAGFASEASAFLQKILIQPFRSHFSKGGVYELLRLRDPLMILLDLSSKREVPKERIDRYVEWASEAGSLIHGSAINRRCARLGRCADSIGAQVCLELALKVSDMKVKGILLHNGISIASGAAFFNRRNGFKVAMREVTTIRNQLQDVAAGKAVERVNRRSSQSGLSSHGGSGKMSRSPSMSTTASSRSRRKSSRHAASQGSF